MNPDFHDMLSAFYYVRTLALRPGQEFWLEGHADRKNYPLKVTVHGREQIETPAGVENVAEVAATDGVDLLFVGPFDLSASLGYLGEPDHPVVRGAIDGVEQAANAAGKLLGAIPTPGRTPEELYAAGYDLVVGGPDNGLLREAARAEAIKLKAAR